MKLGTLGQVTPFFPIREAGTGEELRSLLPQSFCIPNWLKRKDELSAFSFQGMSTSVPKPLTYLQDGAGTQNLCPSFTVSPQGAMKIWLNLKEGYPRSSSSSEFSDVRSLVGWGGSEGAYHTPA